MIISVEVMVEVEDKREGKRIVDFIPCKRFIIKVESLKDQIEQSRETNKLDSSLSPYFSLALCAVIQILLI